MASQFRLFILLALSQACASVNMYGADVLDVTQVMTQEDMAKTGIGKLSYAEKVQFDTWLTQWTQAVVNQSGSYHSSKTIPEWIKEWPAYAQPLQNPHPTPVQEEKLVEEKAEANRVIDKIRNDGEVLELKDGSVWLVSPYDRHKTRRWQRNDAISISTTENVWRPYRLKNITRIQVADAELKQEASPTGEKSPEDPEYFADSIGVEQVFDRGELVVLVDKTTWKIAPADQIRAKTWKKDDRIRVAKTDNYLYQYSLSNLDSGETVLANDSKKE